MKIQLILRLCPSFVASLFILGAKNACAQQNDFYAFQGALLSKMDQFNSFSLGMNEKSDLFVETSRSLYKFSQRQDSAGLVHYSYTAYIDNFALNSGNTFDLNLAFELKAPLNYEIVAIYDVDHDQRNDIIARKQHELSWFRNEGEGRYSAPVKVREDLNANCELWAVQPGMITVSSYTPKSSEYALYDFRNGPSDIRYQHVKLKAPSHVLGVYREDGRDYLVVSDATDRVKFQAFGTSKPSWEMDIGSFEIYFTITDFNKDGHLDMVNSNDLDLRLYWGEGEGLLAKAGNLLEPIDSAFLQEITGHFVSNSYYTWEEYKDMCLDWLSTGYVSSADLNADGYPDILYHQEFFIAYLNNQDGSFTRHVLGGPYDPHEYTLVDFNQDGNLEILINAYSGQFLIQNTGNAFEETQLSPKGYEDAFLVTDIDKDGDADVLFCSEAKALEWSENKGGTLLEARTYQVIK